jgi:hypothetical protein
MCMSSLIKRVTAIPARMATTATRMATMATTTDGAEEARVRGVTRLLAPADEGTAGAQVNQLPPSSSQDHGGPISIERWNNQKAKLPYNAPNANRQQSMLQYIDMQFFRTPVSNRNGRR